MQEDSAARPARSRPLDASGAEDIWEASRRAVSVLLEALPEAAPLVAELVEDCGEEISAGCIFGELAGITSTLLDGAPDEEDEERLERIFAAVETVATTPGVDAVELVAFSFLDGLSPGALVRAQPYLGPRTEELLERLTADELDLEQGDERA